MTVNKYLMPIIAIAALVAVVLGARLTGDWIVSGKQIPLGDMTAADIKGWMTLQNVSDGLKIPLPVLYKLAGIPEGTDVPPTTAMKDLEGFAEGFEVSLLREAAAAYLAGSGAPAQAQAAEPSPPTATAVPATAVPVTPVPMQLPGSVSTATSAPPQAAAPEAAVTPHTPRSTGEGTGDGPTPLPPGQVLPYDQIKGKMTLQEIAGQCAVPLAELLDALTLPANTNPATEVKSLVADGKVAEVTAVRDAVRVLQGK
jgi:hypothetical protein